MNFRKLSNSATRHLLILPCAVLLLAVSSARADNRDSLLYLAGARYIHTWNTLITDIVADDSHTPCVISRIYAYSNIAAYQAAVPGFPICRSLEGQLTGLTNVPKPDLSKRYDWRISAITAYKIVCDRVLFRYYRSDSLYDVQMAEITASGVPADVISRSKEYGGSVGKHIVGWLDQDGYTKNQARSKYVFPQGEGLWVPTPPDFAEPVDPYWYAIRPFTLDSGGEYRPDPPVPYSTKKSSPFYKQAMEVYRINKSLTDSQTLVAKFWDCNPIHSFHRGHLMFKTRQISPGGHWLSITKILCEKNGRNMMESLEAYTMTAVGLADAFISCWTEKYRSNNIRPITYIQKYIDSTWEPLLQTPPFPEHASGHSTISASAATVLTHIFGEISFDDDTEVYLGMPVRHFPSFLTAAHEAAMSRLWGGIHYRRANDAGFKNGQKVGEHVWRHLRTRA
jgi:hypothetical protein